MVSFKRNNMQLIVNLILFGVVSTILLVFIIPEHVQAVEKEYIIQPASQHISKIPVEKTKTMPSGQAVNGLHVLLVDYQTILQQHDIIHFKHIATKPVNGDGLEEAAQINVVFDPTYEKLVIHQIDIHRDGEIYSHLKKANINIVQREKELESQIYDASKTAVIILEDIRIGDVVEYSFSIHGYNPVFAGDYSGKFGMKWGMPIAHMHTRLVVPKDRNLNIKNHGLTLEPVVHESTNFREYLWHQVDVQSVIYESDTPTWYDPYPWIQLSEFPSWRSVVKWALPLYEISSEGSDNLDAQAKVIASSGKSQEEIILNTLQFVQNEIRYMGFEIGSKTHAPYSPSQVLERRFGDCKDKSLLMVNLLKILGVDAHVALVNTEARRAVSHWHPTPVAFNHALVVVTFNERRYWFDPTVLYQKGDLETLTQANFDLALVISEDSYSLVHMDDTSDTSQPLKKISELFDLSGGFAEPSLFTVQTVFEGKFADYTRRILVNSSKKEIQENYVNFYLKSYPSLSLVKEFIVEDVELENRLIITEYYKIQNIWSKSRENEQQLEVTFYPSEIDSYLSFPEQVKRLTPLNILYPIEILQKTTVLLPEPWPVKTETSTINAKAFWLESNVEYEKQKVTLNYKYKSLVDSLSPEDVAEYVQDLKSAENEMGQILYRLDPASQNKSFSFSEMNWLVLFAAILITIMFVFVAIFIYRKPTPLLVNNEGYGALDGNGIGGWLIFAAIGIIFSPFRLLKGLYDTLPSYSLSSWTALTDSTSAFFDINYAPLLLFELVANIGLIVFSVLLIFLFFNERRSFPKVYVVYLLIYLFVLVVDCFWADNIPSAAIDMNDADKTQLIKQAFFSALWIGYFRMSKRVKNTFVH